MKKSLVLVVLALFVSFMAQSGYAEEDVGAKALKSGLVGAGTGAIAAGVTGGKAGKGALIGAGTGAIGSVLLDAITAPPKKSIASDEKLEPGEYFEEAPKENPTAGILKDGLVGAGTGAIAAGVSGGKAGEGALIGAGTGIIGNVLLDAITNTGTESKPRKIRKVEAPKTKTIKKYDDEGNLIYEEVVTNE